VVISAAMILVVAVFAVEGTHLAGQFTDALGVAHALEMHGQWYGAAFSIVLLDASIIGASAVTLSTWLNVLSSVIIGVLLVLSGTLVVTTLFTSLDASKVAVWIAIGLAAGAVLAGAWFWLPRNRRPPPAPHPRTTMSEADRMNWRMPPIALLKPAEWSVGRKVALLALRGYLVISVLLLIVKAVKLGGG
jgi:hypothetical protein